MAIYYAVGDAFVTTEEIYEKQATGQLSDFREAFAQDRARASLEFQTGALTGTNLRASVAPPAGEPTPFEPIGPGKPLTIEIRHVYTGKFPQPFLLDKRKDMLVTTAIKSLASFNAAPRAVNFVEKDVAARHSVRNPAATEKGTPLVYYSPALTEKNTLLTVEMGFDEFPDELFGMVAQALTQAAGIPLFVSASAHLLTASAITKLVGRLGSRMFDRSPVFEATEPLSFLRPGDLPPEADFRLVTTDDAEPELLRNYAIGRGGELVDAGGNAYAGSTPYVIISLDGRRNDQYADFAPTSASAALLEKFYSIRDGEEQPLGPLMDALKLYNDVKFRREADRLAAEIERLQEGSVERKEKEAQREAALANIVDELLKPDTDRP